MNRFLQVYERQDDMRLATTVAPKSINLVLTARGLRAIALLGQDILAEMLALATLTKPGPFFARTHQLGAFIGVRVDGRLVAMAGERMRPDGYTEASGVCVHPDHRGKGYAARLLREVTAGILARGDKAFLHSYADNATAIGLYESLGYRGRREVVFTVVKAAE